MEKVLVTPAEAAELLGITRSTLSRWRREPEFPKSIQLGPQAVRFRVADILAYIDLRDARSRASEVTAPTSDPVRPWNERRQWPQNASEVLRHKLVSGPHLVGTGDLPMVLLTRNQPHLRPIHQPLSPQDAVDRRL